MEAEPLTAEDEALLEAATDCLEAHYEPARHEVASALRTATGEVYTAINLVPSVGTAAVHCEPITVANALRDGHEGFETSVAVGYADPEARTEIVVLSACGVCRELLREFTSGIDIVVPSPEGPVKAPVETLLPGKG